MDQINDPSLDFTIERIHETELIEPPKFFPVRFRSVKQ